MQAAVLPQATAFLRDSDTELCIECGQHAAATKGLQWFHLDGFVGTDGEQVGTTMLTKCHRS